MNIHGKHHIAILTSENGNYLPWLTVHFHDHDKQERHCNEMPSHERRPHHMGYITVLHHWATSLGYISLTFVDTAVKANGACSVTSVAACRTSGLWQVLHSTWMESINLCERETASSLEQSAAQSQAVIRLVQALTEDSIIWTLTPQRSVNCF